MKSKRAANVEAKKEFQQYIHMVVVRHTVREMKKEGKKHTKWFHNNIISLIVISSQRSYGQNDMWCLYNSVFFVHVRLCSSQAASMIEISNTFFIFLQVDFCRLLCYIWVCECAAQTSMKVIRQWLWIYIFTFWSSYDDLMMMMLMWE